MHVASLSFASFALSVTVLAAPGCAPAEDDEFRALMTGGNSGGGTVFNTNMLDEREFSELAPLDLPHMGWALEGVSLGGAAMAEVTVDAGALVVVDKEGAAHEGAELEGSVWSVGYAMGMLEIPIVLREVLAVDGVPHYRFTHTREEKDVPTCPPGLDGPGHTRVLEGLRIDEATGAVTAAPGFLYLACDTGATGKAAALGYHEVAVANADLDLFEVGLRAIRADYCYDGVAQTTAGVELVIEDVWGIHGSSEAYGANPVEAVWGRDGLICRGQGRLTDIKCDGQEPAPVCAKHTHFSRYPDALYITRVL